MPKVRQQEREHENQKPQDPHLPGGGKAGCAAGRACCLARVSPTRPERHDFGTPVRPRFGPGLAAPRAQGVVTA